MKLIAQIKLNPTPEQHAALLATLAEANAACDTISAAVSQRNEFRRLPLQKLVYHDIKASFRLGAQILVRCIAKVADAYKLDRKTKRTFQPHGAVAFDDRNLTWYTDIRCCIDLDARWSSAHSLSHGRASTRVVGV
jgi:putative transposase